MKVDVGILVAIIAIALGATIFDPDSEMLPVSLLAASLVVFYLERVFIGEALSFSAMTVPSVFLLVFISILCLGCVVMWGNFDGDGKLWYLLALLTTLVVFPLGVWMANIAGRVFFEKHGVSGRFELSVGLADQKFEDWFWISLLVSGVLVVVFFVFSTNVQLIDVVLPNPLASDPESERFAQAELPKAVQYLFEITRRVLLPLCMLYAYFMMEIRGGRWRWIFILVFAAALLGSLLTLDRSPPMGILAMIAVAYYITHRGSAYTWGVLLLIVVFAILMAGMISIFQYQISAVVSVDDVVETSWYVVTYRLFGSPAEMAIRAFETYNYDTHFLHGEYTRLLGVLLDRAYVDSTTMAGDPLGAAPVTFVGDLWRNWGWEGVVIGAFAYGFLFQFLQLYIFDRMTVLRGAIYVLLVLGSLALIHGNAFGIVILSVISLAGLAGIVVSQFESRDRIAFGNS